MFVRVDRSQRPCHSVLCLILSFKAILALTTIQMRLVLIKLPIHTTTGTQNYQDRSINLTPQQAVRPIRITTGQSQYRNFCNNTPSTMTLFPAPWGHLKGKVLQSKRRLRTEANKQNGIGINIMMKSKDCTWTKNTHWTKQWIS
jgi:hypothetical protein